MLPPVQCYYNKRKLLGYVALGLLMTAAAAFCTTIPHIKAQLAGWFGLVFFGGIVVMLISRLFTSKPPLTISAEGVEDLRWKIGVIPWTDILAIDVQSITVRGREHKYIALRLRNQTAHEKRFPAPLKILAAMNKAIGYSPFLVNCRAFDADMEQVLRVLIDYHRIMTVSED